MSDTVKLSAVGTLKATLGAGKINVNDYTLTVETVEGGTSISITRGSQTDTVFVPDYSEDEERRVTNENARITNEKSRETAEDTRDTEEAKRQTAEAGRVTAEDARADAETKRTDAETARATAEAGRDAAEAGRVDAESKRVTAEKERKAEEETRVTAEEKRVDAETARAAAETSRASAESARATAEDARAKAESQRETNTTAAISKADAATESAQSVADTVQAKLDAGELDGYSPSASVTQTDTGATISITDKSGTSTADVQNGSDATVTKDAVISALGYEPEQADKSMLIAHYKTTEDVTEIVITEDADGNALDLCGFTLRLYVPTPFTDTRGLGFTWGAFYTVRSGTYDINGELNTAYGTLANTQYVYTCTIKAIGATYEVWSIQGYDNNNGAVYRKPASFDVSTENRLKQIMIVEWHGRSIPSGSTVICYGYY